MGNYEKSKKIALKRIGKTGKTWNYFWNLGWWVKEKNRKNLDTFFFNW